MDNERPNERTSWSSRLEEPGALPGTGLTDKEAAWDKLYDRLKESETPRRKRMIWFWAAAASFLLIVVPAALLLKDRHDSTRQGPPPIPVAINPPQPHTHPTAPGQLSHPAPSQSNQLTPDQAHHPAPGQSYQLTPDQAYRPTPGHPSHPNPGPSAHPPMMRSDLNKLLAHNADTLTLVFAPRPDLSRPPAVVAAAPPKKAPRVVHINELEPPQPTPATVKGPRAKPGGLHIGLVPQETFRPSTTYAEPEAPSIISLKHTQNP